MDKDEPMCVLASVVLRSSGQKGNRLMVGAGIDLAASAAFMAFRATVPFWTLEQCANPFFQNGSWGREMAQALYLCCAEEAGALSSETALSPDWWKDARHHAYPIEDRFARGQAHGLTASPLDQGGHPKLMIAELAVPEDIFMVWPKNPNDLDPASKSVCLTQKMAPKIEEALRATMTQLGGEEAIFVSGSALNAWAFTQRMNAWGDRQQIQAAMDETDGVKNDGGAAGENRREASADGPRSL